jgi:hypothetical protein
MMKNVDQSFFINENEISILNLTPHDVRLVLPNEKIIIWQKSSQPLRLKEVQKTVFNIDVIDDTSISCINVKYKDFLHTNMPHKVKNQFYIVSLVVAQAFPDRSDFLIVNDTIRDEDGRIIGCESLARVFE